MTTTTLTPAQENVATRNRRYQYAKETADKVNALFAELSNVGTIGEQLSAEQVVKLIRLVEDFVTANSRADRAYGSYSEFCDDYGYKERAISYSYPYSSNN